MILMKRIRKMKSLGTILLGTIGLLGMTPCLHAQSTEPSVSFAMGVAMLPDYEGSDTYEAVPLTLGRVEWASGRYISLRGLSLSANVLASDTWEFGPVLSYRMERDDVDHLQVDALMTVDSALEAGLFAAYNTGRWELGAEFRADVSDAHDGWLVELEANYALLLEKDYQIFLGGFASYADSNYMDTYFSVNELNGLRSGFRMYDAGAGFKDLGLELLANYQVNDSWSIIGLLQVSKLLGDAADSPLVDDAGSETQVLSGLALNYRF